jgi:hypothetical protein
MAAFETMPVNGVVSLAQARERHLLPEEIAVVKAALEAASQDPQLPPGHQTGAPGHLRTRRSRY